LSLTAPFRPVNLRIDGARATEEAAAAAATRILKYKIGNIQILIYSGFILVSRLRFDDNYLL